MGFIVAFFIQLGESMIHHASDLFHDICNTINEHNRRQNHYLSIFLFITSSASCLILTFMLSIFGCITRSSSLSMQEIKLFGIAYCIFPV